MATLHVVGHTLRRRAGAAAVIVREVDMISQIRRPILAKVIVQYDRAGLEAGGATGIDEDIFGQCRDRQN